METWGANGGIYTGGNYCEANEAIPGGGYVTGYTNVKKSSSLYVYVGQKGMDYNKSADGGWNGGGNGDRRASINPCFAGSGGGGATDIRTVSGDWNNANSLRSRIIVAGASVGGRAGAGYAGGLSGYGSSSTGATQTSGGAFGIGQSVTTSGYYDNIGGAGGGWYGGKITKNTSSQNYAGGGSSYISGMSGSIGVTNTGAAKCSAGSVSVSCSQSWTGYTFTNTLMIDGAGHEWKAGKTTAETTYYQMPNPSGGYYASGVGHSGNGAARITYLGPII